MQQRNADPATRYEVELACGHTAVNAFPPMGSKVVCRECPDLAGTMRPWLAFNDTRLDLRTVRTIAA